MSVNSINHNSFSTYLFDFDGVIVQTEKLKFLAYQQAFLKVLNQKIDGDDMSWVGLPEKEVTEFFFKRYNVSGTKEDIILEKRKWYYDHLDNNPIPYTKGILEFAKKLDQMGKKLGLVTNSRRAEIEKVLRGDSSLIALFELVVTLDDITRKKPDPEPYLKAIHHFQSEPNEVLVFEDSLHGVHSAERAQTQIVLLKGSGVERSQSPKICLEIDNFCE